MKNVYEVSIGIGSPIRYYHAHDEKEVEQKVKNNYPELRRYKDMNEDERRVSCVQNQFKDTYHINLLLPEVYQRLMEDHERWVYRLQDDIKKAESLLNQLKYDI